LRRVIFLILAIVLCSPAASALTKEEASRIERLKIDAIDYFNMDEYKKAVPLLNEILSIDPQDKTASRYLLIFRRQVKEPYCKLAAEAYMSGDYPEAISQWEKILELDPDDMRVRVLVEETFTTTDDTASESMFELVNKLIREGRYDDAESELKKILQSYPENQQARLMLDSIHRSLTDTTIKSLYDQANIYIEKKEYDLAIEQWKKVLAIDKGQELASRQIAKVQKKRLDDLYTSARKLYIQGDYIGSRDNYNRILADNPTDMNTKKIVRRLNDTINIVPQLKQKGKVWGILRKGLTHHISLNGNPKVAVAAAWYAMQLKPENTLIMAILDFIEREHISVIRTMEGPVKEMKMVDQYLFASLNHIYEGRYDLAIQECRLVLELEPNNVLALKRLGSAYYAMGKRQSAKNTWNRALKLNPKDRELREFIKQVK
jgi:tetratricopeptide (TPR) repeat protein